MNKNKFKIFALDGPWGPSSGNNNRGSGGFSGGNNDSIDDLLKEQDNEILSFHRFKVGDGIDTATKDFAEEVAEQLK